MWQKHYDVHFGELKELLLFRMASLCYIFDPEKELKDVGDNVEEDAVPLEGLDRAARYLAKTVAYFALREKEQKNAAKKE